MSELPESIKEIFSSTNIMIENHKIFNVEYVEITVEKSIVTGRYFSMITYMIVDDYEQVDKTITFLTNIRADNAFDCAIDTAKSVITLYPLSSTVIETNESGDLLDTIDITEVLKEYAKPFGGISNKKVRGQ